MADGATPRMATAQKNLFAMEGGMTTPRNNPTITPGGFRSPARIDLLGLAHKTDTELDKYPKRRQALERLRAVGLVSEESFKNATPKQVAAAHRAYFDHVLASAGGADALETIRDDHAASVLADTMFQHGASGGTLIIQRAVNRRLKELGKNILLDEDEKMSPDVLAYYNNLVSERDSRERLMQHMVEERRRYMKEAGQDLDSGEETRFTYYRGGSATGDNSVLRVRAAPP